MSFCVLKNAKVRKNLGSILFLMRVNTPILSRKIKRNPRNESQRRQKNLSRMKVMRNEEFLGKDQKMKMNISKIPPRFLRNQRKRRKRGPPRLMRMMGRKGNKKIKRRNIKGSIRNINIKRNPNIRRENDLMKFVLVMKWEMIPRKNVGKVMTKLEMGLKKNVLNIEPM